MESIIKCANCGKEIPEEKSVFHELKKAGISWYNCYECEEELSTHGDKPFVAPKEEPEEKERKKTLTQLIARLEKNKDKSDEEIIEFNEVISYFKGLMERHGIVAKIISDNLDHKYFMDELNNHTYSKDSSCTIALDNRIWICTSNDDIVKIVFIDDRTTKKDLTTEVKEKIIELFQESEIATMKKKHKKELDLLNGTYKAEIKTNMTPGETPPKFVPNRSRRL